MWLIPESVRSGGNELLWIIGLVMAVLTLYVMVQKNWPAATRVIRRVVRFLWRWVILLIPRGAWAFWRQLCRDEHGVSRGPLTRVAEFAARRYTELTTAAVAPEFAAAAARSTEQHDAQNLAIASIDLAVKTGFTNGGARMDRIEARLDNLETRDEAAVRTVGIVEAVQEAAAVPE